MVGHPPSQQFLPPGHWEYRSFPTSVDMQVENTDVGLPTLDAATLAALLTGSHAWPIDRVMLIDCRFSYEFAGGCISGAQNIQVASLTPRSLRQLCCELSSGTICRDPRC